MSATVTVVNFNEFTDGLKRFAERSKELAVIAQRKATMQIGDGCRLANPVDTGRMRAGWIESVGEPSGSAPAALPYVRKGERASVLGGHALVSTANSAVGNAELATLEFGQTSWVVNNVEYSGFVNDLHPTQSGFVEAVVENVATQFNVTGGEVA